MSKKRYEVIGIPIGAPFGVLRDKRVGDVFEYVDLDVDVETLLVGAQSLRILPMMEAKPKEPEQQVAAKEKPAAAAAPVEPVEKRKPEQQTAGKPQTSGQSGDKAQGVRRK